MKLIYSELKKLLPNLDKEPQILRDDLTMIGHFTNFYEKIDDEVIFDLDIKVNRPDALGYYGLARDLSVYYNLPLNLPLPVTLSPSEGSVLPITISSSDVIRLQAIKLSDIKTLATPDWLKKFLNLHQINSINALVDLTNYIMLYWGIPNHAFDISKTSENLIWKNIETPTKFITLDGTKMLLSKPALTVANASEVLSLSFIGGQNSGIDQNTTETIIEMAAYNPSRVRTDWRNLKTVTEAAIRLEKELDSQTIEPAFNHLISLVCEVTGAKIASPLFDYQPSRSRIKTIEFDFDQPSVVSGITIPKEFAVDVLTRLGCTINDTKITPPSIRHDITASEDLVEEIIRFWGYQKIPITIPLETRNYPDITPSILYLIETIKDKFVALGYDEVLTWPMVTSALTSQSIATQNSLNAEYPYLRQSIIQSLSTQVDHYQRLKLVDIQIFEIGKVFSYSKEGTPIEKWSLGIYNADPQKLSNDIKTLKIDAKITGNYAEVILDDLEKPNKYIPKIQENAAYELTSQLISLDANVEYQTKQDNSAVLNQCIAKIDKNILWGLSISDIYHNQKTDKYRYTFRAIYFNCDDKTAKAIHTQTFNLN